MFFEKFVPNMSNAKPLQSYQNKMNPFVYHLLNMDARFRVFDLYDEVSPDKGFFVTKQFIFMPICIPRAEHEISHMVELNNIKRMLLPDWGMVNFSKRFGKG